MKVSLKYSPLLALEPQTEKDRDFINDHFGKGRWYKVGNLYLTTFDNLVSIIRPLLLIGKTDNLPDFPQRFKEVLDNYFKGEIKIIAFPFKYKLGKFIEHKHFNDKDGEDFYVAIYPFKSDYISDIPYRDIKLKIDIEGHPIFEEFKVTHPHFLLYSDEDKKVYIPPKLLSFMNTQFEKELKNSEKVFIDENEAEKIRQDLKAKGFKKELKPFQYVSVKMADSIIEKSGVFLNADPMGAGKTVQTLASIIHQDGTPAVIFAPSTVCYNWENEIEESTNKSVIVLDSKKLNKFFKEKKIPDKDFYVIPYSVPSSWGRKDNKTEWLMEELLKKGIKFVVADEAHNLQQLSTKKAKFITELAQKSGAKFYLLTGTIYTTDPYTSYYLYSLSNLGRRMFMNRKTFVERYAKTKEIKKENKTIKIPYGSKNERELQATLRRFLMVKRDRDTILKGLPAVRDLIVRKEWNDPKKKSTYDFLVDSFKETGGDPSLFPEMRKTIAEDKIEDLIERLKDIEETWKNGTNQGKVLVFAHYQDTQKLIRETLQKKFKDFETVALYSDLNDSQRKEVLERFKNDDRVKVLVASLSMAKEGLNLTEATEAIFYELPFTYNDFEQAKARIYRIGQEHPVTFTVLLKRDSYDIDLWKKIKRREANFKNAVSFLQAVLLGNGSFKPKK